MEFPSYYAVIPASVRYANISANAKLLYGEITCLTQAKGYCWATNAHFAELYGVHSDTVSKWVSELVKIDAILIEVIKSHEGTARRIKLVGGSAKTPNGVGENAEGGVGKNADRNNTSTNTNNEYIPPVSPPPKKDKRHANAGRSLSEVIADNQGTPPAEWGEWAHERFGWDGERISAEWEQFGPNFWLTDNARKYGGGRKLDWFATWRNHCLKASERGGSGRPGGKADGGIIAAARASLANRYGAAPGGGGFGGGDGADTSGSVGERAFNSDGSPVIPF